MKYLDPKADLTFKCVFGEHPAFTDAQLAGYEKFWDIISVEKTLYNSAERRGLQKGLQEGWEKGKAEEQRLIAANLKKQGVSVEVISQCTGLSGEEIALL